MSNSLITASVLTPALSPAYISADDAAVYAHTLIAAIKSDVVYGGFILAKHNRYYATLPQSGSGLSFDPASVLSLSEEGLFLPIEGYTIEGMYHSNTTIDRVAWTVHSESELQDSFFSIQDLSLAIRYRHNYPRFYLSCPDKGVLSYIASGSDLEQALLPLFTRTRPQHPSTFERAYDLGSLMPSHLIGLICLAGDLSVVLPGGQWSRRSKLGPDWKLDQQREQTEVVKQPLCEKVFGNSVEAVKAVQGLMQLRKQTQFAGFVLKDSSAEGYACTRPIETPFLAFKQDLVFPKNEHGVPVFPDGYQIVGIYLSGDEPDVLLHESTNDLFGDFFSPSNLLISLLLARSMPGCEVFFCAREGGLLRYHSEASVSESELLSQISRSHNTVSDIRAQLFPYDDSAQVYVQRVAEAGRLEVITTDDLWTQEGRVDASWEPFAPLAEAQPVRIRGRTKRFAYVAPLLAAAPLE